MDEMARLYVDRGMTRVDFIELREDESKPEEIANDRFDRAGSA